MLEDNELIDITFESITTKIHLSADLTHHGSREGEFLLVVYIDGYVIERAVDGHGEVVPFVIGIVAVYNPLVFVVIEYQSAVEERDLGAFGIIRSAGREDGTHLARALEPEHEGLVLFIRTREERVRHLHYLTFFHAQRDTLLVLPVDLVGIEGSAVRHVHERLALTFVHRIVCYQLALISRQTTHISLRDLIGRESLGPETNLHHIARKALTNTYRRAARELDRSPKRSYRCIRYFLCTGIETYPTVIAVIDHSHAGERNHLLRQRIRIDDVILQFSEQTVVVGLTETEGTASLRIIIEEGVRCIRILGTNQHIHGERFISDRAQHFGFSVGVLRINEVERDTGGDTGLVGIAYELEVIILIEVVTGDGFVEPKQQVIAYAQDGVSRQCLAEYARYTRIFYTALNRGCAGDEAIAVTTEGYCSQVVLLLHRVALAVETDVLNTTAIDHRLVARSGIIEAVVCIVRAEVHPVIVAMGSEFVLELNMVEVLIVHIKSVDDDRHVPTRRVLRRERIHDPVVMRR